MVKLVKVPLVEPERAQRPEVPVLLPCLLRARHAPVVRLYPSQEELLVQAQQVLLAGNELQVQAAPLLDLLQQPWA